MQAHKLKPKKRGNVRIRPESPVQNNGSEEEAKSPPSPNTKKKNIDDPFARLLETDIGSFDQELGLDFDFDAEGNIIENEEALMDVQSVSEDEGQPEDDSDSESDEGELFFGGGRRGEGAARHAYLRKYAEERARLRRLQAQSQALLARTAALVAGARAARGREAALREELGEARRRAAELKEENEELELQLQTLPTGGAAGGGGRGGGGGGGGHRPPHEAELAARRAAMKGLFSGGAEAEDELLFLEGRRAGWCQRLRGRGRALLHRCLPFNQHIRTVEARYGSSVAAYFVFFQWMILQYLALGALFFVFMVLHILNLRRAGTSAAALFAFGGGILPYFMLYSSYAPAERGQYAWLLLTFLLFTGGATLRKWVVEDRRQKESNAAEENTGGANARYSKAFLCAWDHGLASAQEVADLRLSNGQAAVLALEEDRVRDTAQDRAAAEVAALVLRRLAGGLGYAVLQGCAWGAILYFTYSTETISAWFATQQGLGWLASSVVPAAVSGINAATPMAIKKIVEFERWDTMNMVIKQLTVRMYLAKILNAFIQIFAYLLLADPLLAAEEALYGGLRGAVGVQRSPAFACRADQVGAGLFQLVATEFVVSKFIALGTPAAMKAKAQATKKPSTKSEFETAKAMVSLLYFAALAMVSTIFAPSTLVFVLFFYVTNFVFEMKVLYNFKAKPKRPWKASDAGAFFIKFYLATTSINVLCVCYFLYSSSFPKDCAIQDSITQLCQAGTYDGGTDTCTLGTTHRYYSYVSSTYESEGYPNGICQGACGAFTNSSSAWTVLDTQVKRVFLMGSIYSFFETNDTPLQLPTFRPEVMPSSQSHQVGQTPTRSHQGQVLVFGGLSLAVLLAFCFRSNSFRVVQDFTNVKDRMWQASVQSLEAKVRKLQKTVESLQMQIQAVEETPVSEF